MTGAVGVRRAIALAGLGLGLALAVPAAAQSEPRFDARGLLACLGWTASDAPGDPSCIGSAAQTCMDTTLDGFAPLNRILCLEAETGFWQAELDDMVDDLAAREPGTAAGLHRMIGLWAAYRDAACDYAMGQGGSRPMLTQAACRMEMTAHKVLDLRAQTAP